MLAARAAAPLQHSRDVQVCNLWRRLWTSNGPESTHTRFEDREITTLEESKGNDGLIETGKGHRTFHSVKLFEPKNSRSEDHPTPSPRRDEEQITRSGWCVG